ncbi:MAG: 2-oxoglutarate and iron-dependent oxygenase domain-containing protein [bacterium]
MATEQTIPVVNLQDYISGDDATRAAFIQTLGEGLKEFGFLAVEGHGVPVELIKKNYATFKRLFELELDTKKKYERPEFGRQRGYTSFGVEQAKGHDKADLKEFWHVGRELADDHPLHGRMAPNQWPTEMPEVKTDSLALYEAMDACGKTLLRAISEYLGLEPEFLPGLAKDGNSVLRVIHYPVCDGFDEPGMMRAAAHEDINLITLLPEATESGLEILTHDGQWLEVPSLPGQLIVDTGDMMKRITNETIPATRHRVVNPKGTPSARYSMPFFVHPSPDASLAVIDKCIAPGEAAKYAPITADGYLKERLRENKVG